MPMLPSRWWFDLSRTISFIGNGVPNRIITDNDSNWNNKMMAELCEEFKIVYHNSSPYRPTMNGVVEAANKNIKKIIQKMVVTYKDWHEILPFSLHGYQTLVHTPTRPRLSLLSIA